MNSLFSSSSFSLYSDADIVYENERGHQERRYVEEYSSNYSQQSETRQRCRDHENGYHNHSSKSSGHSIQSSYKRKHRTDHGRSSHQSHTVWKSYSLLNVNILTSSQQLSRSEVSWGCVTAKNYQLFLLNVFLQ